MPAELNKGPAPTPGTGAPGAAPGQGSVSPPEPPAALPGVSGKEADVLRKLLDSAESPKPAAPAPEGAKPPELPKTQEELDQLIDERVRARAEGVERGLYRKFEEASRISREAKAIVEEARAVLRGSREPGGSEPAPDLGETPAPEPRVQPKPDARIATIEGVLAQILQNQVRMKDEQDWTNIMQEFGDEAKTLHPEVEKILNTEGFERVPMRQAFLMARGAKAGAAPTAPGDVEKIRQQAVEEYKETLRKKLETLGGGPASGVLGPGAAPAGAPAKAPEEGAPRPFGASGRVAELVGIMGEVLAKSRKT